jgi:hypothetical protein
LLYGAYILWGVWKGSEGFSCLMERWEDWRDGTGWGNRNWTVGGWEGGGGVCFLLFIVCYSSVKSLGLNFFSIKRDS